MWWCVVECGVVVRCGELVCGGVIWWRDGYGGIGGGEDGWVVSEVVE